MNKRWLLTLFAVVPLLAGLMAIQSCAGVGGATTDGGGGGGGSSTTAEFLALLPIGQQDATYIGNASCQAAGCHAPAAPGAKNPEHYDATTHAKKGVTCESCHGPGSKHKDGPGKENILTFPKVTSSAVCGQCHGPILDQYGYSKHIKLVESPVVSATQSPAATRTSRCMACHSGLFRTQIVEAGVDIPSMTDQAIKDIANNTISSVPHVAVCSTCHDPHEQTGKLTDTGEEKQLRHKMFNTDTTQIAPGTTAAQFTTFDHGCAQCHNGRGTNPADSALTSSASRPSMHDSNQFNMLMGIGGSEGTGAVDRNTAHATAPGQCSKCHMPDSRHSFTVSYDKGCSPCHTASDAAARSESIKSEILNSLYTLKTRFETWAKARFGDEDLWDYSSLVSELGKTAPSQSLIPIELKRARHNYYFIIRSGDFGVHNAPYAKTLIRVANDNMTTLGMPASKPTTGVSKATMLKEIMDAKTRANRADLREIEAP